MPPYPVEALKNRLQGKVVVDVIVGADGNPTHVKIAKSSGHKILDDAAITTVAKWRFPPGKSRTESCPFTFGLK
jgi:periplasmic protein TonB